MICGRYADRAISSQKLDAPVRDGWTSLVITGFTCTRKTVTGRRVAERVGRASIDMDAHIQAREGTTIKEILSAQGESHFRLCEAQVCQELAESNNLVIATGGG